MGLINSIQSVYFQQNVISHCKVLITLQRYKVLSTLVYKYTIAVESKSSVKDYLR